MPTRRSPAIRIIRYAAIVLALCGGYWAAGRVLSSNGARTALTGPLVRGGLIDEAPPASQPMPAAMPSAATTADKPADQPAPRSVTGGKYAPLAFTLLTKFPYDRPDFEAPDSTPEARMKARLPDEIRAMNGKSVVIEGFMLPLETEGDQVKSFVLCGGHTVCCFGKTPKLNEWICVRMNGTKRAANVRDVLVKVFGQFEIGEELQNGWVTSIYRIHADKMSYKSADQ